MHLSDGCLKSLCGTLYGVLQIECGVPVDKLVAIYGLDKPYSETNLPCQRFVYIHTKFL